ncbi:hypothetical protein SESBI_35846 [Sesbania bispinosa]|nr:hypothetical protein SESBI_35846 [Sesbania bispinosa]
MASLVLFLSLILRPKIRNHASTVTAASLDIMDDASHLHGKWAEQNKNNEFEEIMGEKILHHEPRVRIYLI